MSRIAPRRRGGRFACRALIVPLMIAASFTASPDRAEAACAPGLAPAPQFLSVGPANATDAAINVPSIGAVRAAVLFVDFTDANGTGEPAVSYSGWMTAGAKWLRTSSYGKLDLRLDIHPGWIRMPKPSSAYGFPGVTYATHRDYIADAFAAADAAVDFSQADLVYIVAAPGSAIPQSPTFRGLPGTFPMDGRDLNRVVTFGMDAYIYGRAVFVHETGHLLGLPDLYAFRAGDPHRFVGSWDLMGNIFQPTDHFAWLRLKLGWLTPGQFVCAKSRGTTSTTLTPIGRSGGKKAIFVRTGRYTALIAENRQRVANDRNICDRGLLVYRVDSRVATGTGPIRVIGGRLGSACGYGPRSDAPLHPRQKLVVGKTTFEVTGTSGANLAVRVTRRG